MRDNSTPELTAAVSNDTITTALAMRLDFRSGTVFAWTGINSIEADNTGDSMLDGVRFDAISNDIVDIGENTYSLGGSGELTITLNIPSAPSIELAAAQIYPNEYQGRSAILWRAVKLLSSDPLAPPVWVFRRLRTGSMDKLEIQNDGQSHKFIMTVESFAARVSNATGQTYLNQRWYDPLDTSQDSAQAIANGDPAPTRTSPSQQIRLFSRVIDVDDYR